MFIEIAEKQIEFMEVLLFMGQYIYIYIPKSFVSIFSSQIKNNNCIKIHTVTSSILKSTNEKAEWGV